MSMPERMMIAEAQVRAETRRRMAMSNTGITINVIDCVKAPVVTSK